MSEESFKRVLLSLVLIVVFCMSMFVLSANPAQATDLSKVSEPERIIEDSIDPGDVRSSDLVWPYFPDHSCDVDDYQDTNRITSESQESITRTPLLTSGSPFLSDQDYGAETLAPTHEATWFPRIDTSKLRFQVNHYLSSSTTNLYVHLWVQRDLDTSSRTLYLYFDGNFVTSSTVSSYYKQSVAIPASKIIAGSSHTIEIRIYRGDYYDKGWKLLYVGIGTYSNGQHSPLVDSHDIPKQVYEYTPATGTTDCTMEFLVMSGESTILELTTANGADSTTRQIDVYIQSGSSYVNKGTVNTGTPTSVSLGTYTDNSYRNLRLVFKGVGNIANAKIITRLAVTHVAWRLEVDYMATTDWTQAKISTYIDKMNNDWFESHSYHRVLYEFSDVLPYDPQTTAVDFEIYAAVWNNHKIAGWEYTAWVADLYTGTHPLGWYLTIGYGFIHLGIGISAYSYYDTVSTTIWHEYGHHVGAVEISLFTGEVYCGNYNCVMAQEGGSNCMYCQYHWLMRNTNYL